MVKSTRTRSSTVPKFKVHNEPDSRYATSAAPRTNGGTYVSMSVLEKVNTVRKDQCFHDHCHIPRWTLLPPRQPGQQVPHSLKLSWANYRTEQVTGHVPIPAVSTRHIPLCREAIDQFPQLANVPWIQRDDQNYCDALDDYFSRFYQALRHLGRIHIPNDLQVALVIHTLPEDLQRNIRSFLDHSYVTCDRSSNKYDRTLSSRLNMCHLQSTIRIEARNMDRARAHALLASIAPAACAVAPALGSLPPADPTWVRARPARTKIKHSAPHVVPTGDCGTHHDHLMVELPNVDTVCTTNSAPPVGPTQIKPSLSLPAKAVSIPSSRSRVDPTGSSGSCPGDLMVGPPDAERTTFHNSTISVSELERAALKALRAEPSLNEIRLQAHLRIGSIFAAREQLHEIEHFKRQHTEHYLPIVMSDHVSHATCLLGDTLPTASSSSSDTPSGLTDQSAQPPPAPSEHTTSTNLVQHRPVSASAPSIPRTPTTPATPVDYTASYSLPSPYDKHYADIPDNVVASLVSSDDEVGVSAQQSTSSKSTSKKRRFTGHGWSKKGTKTSRRQRRIKSSSTLFASQSKDINSLQTRSQLASPSQLAPRHGKSTAQSVTESNPV